MKFKILLLSFLLLLILGSCGEPASTPTTTTPITTAPTEPAQENTAVEANTEIAPTHTPESVREAVFTEIIGEVEFRPSSDDEYSPAQLDDIILVGGQAQTGEEGRTKLDVLPDGTIIRLSELSIFTLTELNPGADNPITKIILLLGDLWIVLNGGSLEVDTPSGVATVRGSMMGVGVDPDTGKAVVTCLEGRCSIENEYGLVSLEAGQAAEAEDGQPPSDPRPMTLKEFEYWREEVPEAHDVLEEALSRPQEGGLGEAGSFEGAVGFWEGVDDEDGGRINLTIQSIGSDMFSVYYINHSVPACGTDASGSNYAAEIEGTGKADGNILSVPSQAVCLDGTGDLVRTFTLMFIYDPTTDTLQGTGGGDTWHRSD